MALAVQKAFNAVQKGLFFVHVAIEKEVGTDSIGAKSLQVVIDHSDESLVGLVFNQALTEFVEELSNVDHILLFNHWFVDLNQVHDFADNCLLVCIFEPFSDL